MYTELKKQEASMAELRKARKVGASNWAKLAAYGVAIASIMTLSAIYAQTTSAIFVDPVMKAVGTGAALVVGASSIVFLVFKNSLLKSAEQFRVAVIFMLVEFSALTLGAFHQFAMALGWDVGSFITELTKIAVVMTLPIVGLEWITILSLDPEARMQRSENHSKADLARTERETRDGFRMSDPVVKIRRAAALTEVIHEELLRLPTDQRDMFVGILRGQHGAEFDGVPFFLGDGKDRPDVIDQKGTASTENEEPEQSVMGSIKSKFVTAFGVADEPAKMQTMAAEAPMALGLSATIGDVVEVVDKKSGAYYGRTGKIEEHERGWYFVGIDDLQVPFTHDQIQPFPKAVQA